MSKSKERILYYHSIICKKNSSLNTKKDIRDFREGIKLIQEGDFIIIKQISFAKFVNFFDISFHQ